MRSDQYVGDAASESWDINSDHTFVATAFKDDGTDAEGVALEIVDLTNGSVLNSGTCLLSEACHASPPRLEQLRAEQQALTAERQSLSGERRVVERDLDRAYSRVSWAVVGDASRAGGMYASRSNYSVGRVKTRL